MAVLGHESSGGCGGRDAQMGIRVHDALETNKCGSGGLSDLLSIGTRGLIEVQFC
jgi:hypothetical protein